MNIIRNKTSVSPRQIEMITSFITMNYIKKKKTLKNSVATAMFTKFLQR